MALEGELREAKTSKFLREEAVNMYSQDLCSFREKLNLS